jgi:chromosome segregation ATPase
LFSIAALVNLAACAAPEAPGVAASANEPQQVRETRSSLLESSGMQDGSQLAALTAEVRQLRLAIEEHARSEAQTRALEASLSAQQSRMLATEESLEAVRTRIDTVARRIEEIEDQLSGLAGERSRTTATDTRLALDEQAANLETQLRANRRSLEQARGREDELSRALQIEETKFNELVARLQRLAGQ